MTAGAVLPRLLVAALATLAGLPATADTLSCPDLAQAVQINACPSEEELQYTFTGYCSDNAQIYAGKTDPCVRYESYRKLKNVALWESPDGRFDGYISCDVPRAEFAPLQPTGVRVVAQGKLNKVVCAYPKGIAFTFRTKAACAVPDAAACAAGGDACRAVCD